MAPAETARMIKPIIEFCMRNYVEPIQWQGGIAHEILKSGKSPFSPSGYRFVVLEHVIGKVYHKYLRSLLNNHVPTYFLHSMCGGFGGKSIDTAALYVQSFVAIAVNRKLRWGIFFTDITAAYESLQRFFVFGDKISDQEAISIFNRYNFDKSVFDDFIRVLSSDNAFDQAGVPIILHKLIAAAHECNWFSCEGVKEILITKQGTRAGSPLGDIIFAFLMCRVLMSCRNKLQDLAPNFSLSKQDNIFGVVNDSRVEADIVNYVDDNLFAFVAKTVQELVANAAKVAAVVVDTFASYLLPVAIGPAKTALLLSNTKRSRNLASVGIHLVDNKPFIKVVSKAVGDIMIDVVKDYKHVGKHLNKNLSFDHDVATRCGMAHDAAGKLRAKVYKSRNINMRQKIVFTNSLVLSCPI